MSSDVENTDDFHDITGVSWIPQDLGQFGKTAISLPFTMGFERAIYQMKGHSFFYHVLKTRLQFDVFPRTYELKSYFFTFIF